MRRPNARDIIRRAAEADQRNEVASRNYTFVQRVAKRYLNSDGSVKRTEIRTYDVTLSEGTPYQRLIAINDKPLPPELERKEQEKLRKSIEERRKESPQERAKRVAQWEKDRQKDRQFVNDLMNAMDFRVTGEEEMAGRKTWVISATPHPGYRPDQLKRSSWSRCAGEPGSTKAITWRRASRRKPWMTSRWGSSWRRSAKGRGSISIRPASTARYGFPQRIEGRFSARLLIVRFRESLDMTFKDFRKFQVESHIVTSGEEHGH